MKFLLLVSAVLSTFITVKADDPSAILSEFWPSGQVPSVTGSALTALASGLASVESSWSNSPEYTSVGEAIFSAAPSATRAALSQGYRVETLTNAPWWTGVPDSAKQAISSEQAALNSVAAKYISISTSKAGAAQAKATGVVGVAVAAVAAGAVGVMAAL